MRECSKQNTVPYGDVRTGVKDELLEIWCLTYGTEWPTTQQERRAEESGLKAAAEKLGLEIGRFDRITDRDIRDEARRRYAYAVTCPEALDALVGFAPLVEIGAGTEWWAYHLRQRGVDIVAYDLLPPDGSNRNPYHVGARTWTEVLHADAEVAAEHPDRTLLLCWPPNSYEGMWDMAKRAVCSYRGNRLIYIGEPKGVVPVGQICLRSNGE